MKLCCRVFNSRLIVFLCFLSSLCSMFAFQSHTKSLFTPQHSPFPHLSLTQADWVREICRPVRRNPPTQSITKSAKPVVGSGRNSTTMHLDDHPRPGTGNPKMELSSKLCMPVCEGETTGRTVRADGSSDGPGHYFSHGMGHRSDDIGTVKITNICNPHINPP